MMKILMCGSTLNTKGGMVSVVKNYLSFNEWNDYHIKYVPTHFDTDKKYLIAAFFVIKYVEILFLSLFCGYKIAHLHTAERGSFWRKRILARTLKALGVRVIMHHHAAEFEDFYAKCNEKQRKKIKKTLELVDVNIVLSQRLISMIISKAPNAKVEVLYNAVNTFKENPYNKEGFYVLFLGRLGQRKGTFDLIQAIKMVDDKIDKRIKFCLCGDMGEKEAQTKIAQYQIQHRIEYIGWVDGEKKKEFLSKAILNVLPSYNEGLPMTILETMAYGIPNISTNIASIPEVIKNGENGFLINPGDVNLLGIYIELLLKDSRLRMEFSEKSYNLIKEKFSLKANVEQLKKIYDLFL